MTAVTAPRVPMALLVGDLFLLLVIFAGATQLPSPRCCHYVNDGKMTVHVVEQAMVHYQTDNTDGCPKSIAELVEQRYLSHVPLDQWRQPLLFKCPGDHNPDGADVISAGPDHMFGTVDDINSWDL
jgi:hypothetical protein